MLLSVLLFAYYLFRGVLRQEKQPAGVEKLAQSVSSEAKCACGCLPWPETLAHEAPPLPPPHRTTHQMNTLIPQLPWIPLQAHKHPANLSGEEQRVEDHFLNSDYWLAQHAHQGHPCLVTVRQSPSRVQVHDHLGFALHAGPAAPLHGLPDCILCGELKGNTFFANDILEMEDVSLLNRPLWSRLNLLNELAHEHVGLNVATHSFDKEALLEQSRFTGVPAITWRRKNAVYEGSPTSSAYVMPLAPSTENTAPDLMSYRTPRQIVRRFTENMRALRPMLSVQQWSYMIETSDLFNAQAMADRLRLMARVGDNQSIGPQSIMQMRYDLPDGGRYYLIERGEGGCNSVALHCHHESTCVTYVDIHRLCKEQGARLAIDHRPAPISSIEDREAQSETDNIDSEMSPLHVQP